MLKLGIKQMTVLNEQARASFESRLQSHLQKFFPQHCEALGEDKIRAAIQLAIQRAALYGIESEHGVCIYADMMFAFGHLFDQDGLHPWATRVLRDPTIHDPADRIERLHQAATAALADGSAVQAAP